MGSTANRRLSAFRYHWWHPTPKQQSFSNQVGLWSSTCTSITTIAFPTRRTTVLTDHSDGVQTLSCLRCPLTRTVTFPRVFFSHTPTVCRRIHCTLEETKETRIHDVSGVQPQNSQKAQPSHSYNNPQKNASVIALSRRFSTANRKCCTQHCSRHDHEVTWTENISWSFRRAECSASTKAIMLAWWIRNSASER